MEKFILPSYNILSNTEAGRAKGVTLFGEAQQFLFQTNLYMKKYPYFQRRRLLEDGSVLTVQKVNRRDYRVYIEPFIPIEEDEEILSVPFLFEKHITNEPILSLDGSLSDKSRGLVSEEPFTLTNANTINSNDGGSKVLAGNIDWRKTIDGDIISWMGPFDRYRNNPAYYSQSGFSFNTGASSGDNVFPFGYATRDNVSFTVTINPDTAPEVRTINHTQIHRYGTSLYSNGVRIADTSDITTHTPVGTFLIVGAGIHEATKTLCVVVKDTGQLENFLLCNVNTSNNTWSVTSSIPTADADWETPGIFHGFFFSQDGTKVVTIIRQYKNKLDLSNLSHVVRFQPTQNPGFGGGDGVTLETRDRVLEIPLINNFGTTVTAQTPLIVRDFTYTNSLPNASFQLFLDGDEYYQAIDYKDNVLNPLIETWSTRTAGLFPGTAEIRQSFTFDGETIPATTLSDTDIFSFVQWLDLRFSVFFMVWLHKPDAITSDYEVVLYRVQNNTLETTSIVNLDQVGTIPDKFYDLKAIIWGGAPGDSDNGAFVQGSGYCQCNINKSGTIFWYCSVGYFELNTTTTTFEWKREEYGLLTNGVDPMAVIFNEVPALNQQRLSAHYDYYYRNWNKSDLGEDIGVCVL